MKIKKFEYFNENKNDGLYEEIPNNLTEFFSKYDKLPFDYSEYSVINKICKEFNFIIEPNKFYKEYMCLRPNGDNNNSYKIEIKKFDHEWYRTLQSGSLLQGKFIWHRCDSFDGLFKFLEDKMSEFRSYKSSLDMGYNF